VRGLKVGLVPDIVKNVLLPSIFGLKKWQKRKKANRKRSLNKSKTTKTMIFLMEEEPKVETPDIEEPTPETPEEAPIE